MRRCATIEGEEMAKKMALPKIGVNMTEAMITKWLVKTGDSVKEGDPVMEAETDKSIQEIYATESGVVSGLLAAEGDTVVCGADILELDGTGGAEEKKAPPAAKGASKSAVAQKSAPAPVAAAKTVHARVSPLAKRTAKELGVDIRLVPPAKPGARVVKNDVAAFANARPASVPTGGNLEVIPLSGTRRTIAARMNESNLQKPSAALTLRANAEALLELKRLYAERGIKVSFDAMIAKIAAAALGKHPEINSVLEGDEILFKRDINVGVAVDTPRGLNVAVLKDAGNKTLPQLAEELARMAADAKESRLAMEDSSGGTFTITNLGMFGIEQFTPIINPPECCILSVGAVKREFVPDEDGLPVVVSRFAMTLVFDHRIVDGAPAAKFLRDVKEMIEMPALLI